MLLQNITIWSQCPYRRSGGSTAAGADGNGSRSIIGVKNHNQLAQFAGGFTNTNSLPSGWQFGNGWMPPMKSGGSLNANLGKSTGVTGAGAFESDGALGLNADAALAGQGDIANAALGLILYAQAILQGVGLLTAQHGATIAAAASLAGSGDIVAAIGAAQAVLAAASLAGSGDLSGAAGALAGMALTLTGAGGAAGSSLTANGSLAASIVVTGSALSTANVAAAVWNALATQHNLSGTMGQKLNGAASAGDPWSTDLPGAYAEGTAGNLLAIVAKLLRNKTVTDPTTGAMTVYDDDGVTALFTAQLHENVAETQTYRGQGAEVRGRLE